VISQWQKVREPKKTKAELREMLTEAVRNTPAQAKATEGRKRSQLKAGPPYRMEEPSTSEIIIDRRPTCGLSRLERDMMFLDCGSIEQLSRKGNTNDRYD